MIIHTTVPTRFGDMQLTAGEAGLRGVHFPGQQHFVEPPAGSSRDPSAEIFARSAEQLDAYARGDLRAFDLPVELVGAPTARAVWAALGDIPYGETTTYGAIARELGRPGMAQAVGQLVGRNPIAIIVPCHRVVGASGALTGYAGGLERKRDLLELEGALGPRLA